MQKSLTYISLIAYSKLGSMHPHAACVNLGGVVPKWYPADKLTIADWQMVRHQLPAIFQAQMVKRAQKSPDANKRLIKQFAFQQLGIGKKKIVA